MISHRSPTLALLSALLLVVAAGPARASVQATDAIAARDTMTFRPTSPPHAPAAASSPQASEAHKDTLTFTPSIQFFDSTGHEPLVVSPPVKLDSQTETEWLRAPMGDHLLDHPDAWEHEHPRHGERFKGVFDYNRVDLVRYGLHYQAQRPRTMYPRIGARFEYATGRKRSLFGVQIEQPLLPTARFVFGVSLVRRTEHPELQQVDDVENSLALLLTRTDYRDYFEREGGGVYVSWRVPDFSTVSLHARHDQYRSLGLDDDVVSWWRLERPLRPNPTIDDGRTNSVLVRLERLAERSSSTRAGLYHWIEMERAGGTFGGDFSFLRLLGDVRSVVRLSPATSLSLRTVAGSCTDGTLPKQKRFGLGGVDGLRAHTLHEFQGNQLALAQAEYTVGLWALRGVGFEAGLHAIAFLDTGTAWDNASDQWDLAHQHFTTDGGFGLATSEDGVRLYVARELSNPSSQLTWSLRYQRPF